MHHWQLSHQKEYKWQCSIVLLVINNKGSMLESIFLQVPWVAFEKTKVNKHKFTCKHLCFEFWGMRLMDSKVWNYTFWGHFSLIVTKENKFPSFFFAFPPQVFCKFIVHSLQQKVSLYAKQFHWILSELTIPSEQTLVKM